MRFTLSAVFLFIIFNTSCIAQEIQVAFDKEGKITVINQALEQKIQYFIDYKDFIEARLFQISDTLYVVEIYYQPEKTVLKKRIQLSQSEISALRERITARIQETAPQMLFDQVGRPKLLIGSTALSLFHYGWAVPVMFNVHNGKTAVALYLLVSSSGFYLPYYLTKNVSIPYSTANLALYGGTRGLIHGSALNVLINNNTNSQNTAGFMMLGSLGEAIAGYYSANKLHLSTGTVSIIEKGGDFGITWGFETAYLLGKGDDNRFKAGSVLVGSGVGLLTGRYLSKSQEYTTGDAGIVRAAGILGYGIGAAAVIIAGEDNDKPVAAATLLGSGIGIGMGNQFVKNKDFSSGQGTLVTLSEIAGGLCGAGIAYLITPQNNNENNEKIYALMSSIGASAGFWGMYHSSSKSANIQKSNISFQYSIAPESAVLLALRSNSKLFNHILIPFFTVKASF